MLRITSTAPGTANSEARILRLDGQVAGPWVEELRRVCDETLGPNGRGIPPLVLDLAGVSFVDAAGVGLIRDLAARRAALTNCSPFVAEQLKEAAHADD